MPFCAQLSACFYRYGIQFKRSKRSLGGLLLTPLVNSFLLYLFRGTFNQTSGEIWGYLALILIGFSYGGYVRVTIGDVVNDRKEKLKELMIMNGLSSFSYNMGVLFVALIKSAIMGLPYCGVFYLVAPLSDVARFYAIFMLAGIAYAPFTLALSTLFGSPKLAIQIGSLVYSLQSFAFLIGQRHRDSMTLQILLSLLPSTPLALTTGSIFKMSTLIEGYSFAVGVGMTLANSTIFYLIFLYLDAVVPVEGEVKKPFCFCISRAKPQKKQYVALDDSSVDPVISKGGLAIELKDSLVRRPDQDREPLTVVHQSDFSSAYYHEDIPGLGDRHKNLTVKRLRKVFNGMAVVDDISFCMYEKEIFCLLGHNGAGKTTTINMLTGILQNDGGEINYDGRDFSQDFEAIRLNIGLCAQKDILFHYLTVREHLVFFGKIRGIRDPYRTALVEKILHKCDLASEAYKLAPTLSGGNKRKLSLGIALIGDPKVVFLDEPTSGMDPNTRRSIWEILKALRKEGKTIVLTTHHLDEADELSNRIAVLTRGKLFCLGSSEFIKKKFGVGYHLVLTRKEQSISLGANNDWNPEEIEKIIQQHIPTAARVEDTAPSVHKFLLPFPEQHKFAKLFSVLETKENLNINLEMNSLEDAFVNIGLEEDKFLAKIDHQSDVLIRPEALQANVPESINQNPKYVFWDQFTAMVLRKLFQTIRNAENLFFYFSPLIFIVFGFLYVTILGGNSEGPNGDLSRTIQLLIYTVLGFSLSSSIYMFIIVKEKQEHVKYMLKVMGCRNVPYWVGSFVADAIIAVFVSAVVALFTLIYDIRGLSNHIFLFCIIVYSYTLNLVALSYFWSWVYSTAVSSQKYFGVLATFLLFILPYACCWIGNEKWWGQPLRYTSYFLSPMATYFDAILCLGIIKPWGKDGVALLPQLWDEPWYYVVVMTFATVIYLVLSIMIDGWGYNLSPDAVRAVQQQFQPQPIADQQAIIAEEQRVSDPNNKDLVKLHHMGKVYSNGFTAVKDVSFGVKKKEIFGLLGPNGAGKSTTFNVMTAMIARSSGSVQLLSREVDRNIYDVFKNVGVCPQFNPLWDNLTVKEHLTIFGKMKGLHGRDLNENIDYFLQIMSLAEHAKKKAEHLSGGNKRKLCVILALLAAPKIQFLDEPSTGLDPIAKKFLWKSLTDNLNQREASIVLTTHSMSEAESLCSRLAIMINGRFVCIGSVEELKAKFGQGYKITLTKVNLAQPSLLEIAQKISPQAVQVPDASQNNETFQVPSDNFSFSKAFSFLESMKMEGRIKDFSIYNTSLEQVFIQFSRFQQQQEQPQATDINAELPAELQVVN